MYRHTVQCHSAAIWVDPLPADVSETDQRFNPAATEPYGHDTRPSFFCSAAAKRNYNISIHYQVMLNLDF